MAENNNNRKSKRNFSLEKPVERRFDIEKEVETTTVASTTTAKPTQVKPGTGTQQKPDGNPQKSASKPQGKDDTPTTPTGGNNDGNGYDNGGDGGNSGKSSIKWIVIALIIAAIAACAYFFMNDNKSDEGTDPQTPQVEQNDSTKNDNNANDSIANSDNENEESIAGEGDEATGESEDNSQEQPNNSNEPVSRPSTSANISQPTGNSSVSQGTASTPSPSSASYSSIEQKAKDVWKGVYGNNPDRRKNLGSDYEAVQKLVNEMHRKGLR